MASSIKLTELKKVTTKTNYTYTDLALDIREKRITVNNLQTTINNFDLIVSFDEEAIKNSLISIFNTRPGQRFLVPLFGCNINRYIFRPISKSTANEIGMVIKRSIELWEPRVKIIEIFVQAFTDINEYDININLMIPQLEIKVSFAYTIDKVGFFTHHYLGDMK